MNRVSSDMLLHVNTIEKAIGILGSEKVVTADQALQAWGLSLEAKNTQVNYSRGTLFTASLVNMAGGGDWRLIYILPISLREQRDIIGVYLKLQPCFSRHMWWILDAPEGKWAFNRPEEGYYLVNFKHVYAGNDWKVQQRKVDRFGTSERTDEHAYCQALISIYRTHFDPLYVRANHWGRYEVGNGCGRVLIDFHGRMGIRVYSFTESYEEVRDNSYKVPTHLTRKFDF